MAACVPWPGFLLQWDFSCAQQLASTANLLPCLGVASRAHWLGTQIGQNCQLSSLDDRATGSAHCCTQEYSHPRSGHLAARNPRSCLHLSLIPRAWAPWIPPVICRRQDLSGAGKHPQGGGAKGPSCSFPLEELQAPSVMLCQPRMRDDSVTVKPLILLPFSCTPPSGSVFRGGVASASPPGLRIFAMVSCL